MFFSGMPITVSSFYKTRITNTGVAREKEIYATQTPRDDSNCSDSFDKEHDELDYCLNDDTQQPTERETEEELTESDNDNDCALATLQHKVKPTSRSSEVSDINEEETETAGKKRKITNQTRWQKKKPHYENTKFIGTEDEEPLETHESPILYFK